MSEDDPPRRDIHLIPILSAVGVGISGTITLALLDSL